MGTAAARESTPVAGRRKGHSVLPQVRRHVARTGGGYQHHDGDALVAVHRGRAGGGVAALVAGDDLVQLVVEGLVAGRVELAAEGLHLLDAGTRHDRGGGLRPLRWMRIPSGAGRQQGGHGGYRGQGHEGGRSPAAGRSRRSAAGRGAAWVSARSDAHEENFFDWTSHLRNVNRQPSAFGRSILVHSFLRPECPAEWS